jgi:hypothetical protein
MSIDKDWYYTVTNDWNKLPECLEYFSNEAVEARKELGMKGRIEKHAQELPAITEKRFTQLQVLNALVRYYEIELEKVRAREYKKYLENYQKALSSRDAEKYTDGEKDVVELNLLINEICLSRNIFTSIIKSLDHKSYTLNNIAKLRTAGLEDATIE